MVSYETVVGEGECAIVPVQRRSVQWVAHSLSPVLVTLIDTVIIVVVGSTNLVRYGSRMVVVYRPTLVGGLQKLVHDGSYEGVLR